MATLSLTSLVACGPHAHIPPRPLVVPDALASDDSDVVLAHALAPVLYLQRDETFPLSRVVAVVHPTRNVIAYHLLWRDDVSGAWIPLTKPTDEEIIWVGYDSTRAPTELWTYWHGDFLHTPVPRTQIAIDVQWGKHGSMPRGVRAGDLPLWRKLEGFYVFTWLGLPDQWAGNAVRKGPWCFCHGYGRYRRYSRPLALTSRLDAVIRTENPRPALHAIFGAKYSGKVQWPKP